MSRASGSGCMPANLQKQCWQSAVALSFPRLRNVPTRFAIPRLLSDRELVQLMLALRLFLPEAGFNLSTREPAELRDHLIPLGRDDDERRVVDPSGGLRRTRA